MEPIIAKCGYRCDLCSAFETNFKSDRDRRDIQRAFKQYYGCEIPLEDIKPCKGCQDAHEAPDQNCEVFPSARQKGHTNCGQCTETFNCKKLTSQMEGVEEILAKQDSLPKSDYDRYFKPYLCREILTQIHNASVK